MPAPKRSSSRTNQPSSKAPSDSVELLSGGNPRIPKAIGDAPVQTYLQALTGWKREVTQRVDALIVRAVPHVQKAIKWNSPFYGIAENGWFLGVHAYATYMKLAFFRGARLQPLPPGESKSAETRYLDIREEDSLDEAQLILWFKQAAALPGWSP